MNVAAQWVIVIGIPLLLILHLERMVLFYRRMRHRKLMWGSEFIDREDVTAASLLALALSAHESNGDLAADEEMGSTESPRLSTSMAAETVLGSAKERSRRRRSWCGEQPAISTPTLPLPISLGESGSAVVPQSVLDSLSHVQRIEGQIESLRSQLTRTAKNVDKLVATADKSHYLLSMVTPQGVDLAKRRSGLLNLHRGEGLRREEIRPPPVILQRH